MRQRKYIRLLASDYRVWSFILSIIAIIVCILVACNALPRRDNLIVTYDYQGVIIGVFSLLVTTLIGWQIYNAIELKKRIHAYVKSIINPEIIDIKQELYASFVYSQIQYLKNLNTSDGYTQQLLNMLDIAPQTDLKMQQEVVDFCIQQFKERKINCPAETGTLIIDKLSKFNHTVDKSKLIAEIFESTHRNIAK